MNSIPSTKTVPKRASRRPRTAHGRPAIPLLPQITAGLNTGDPFIAAEIPRFVESQPKLLNRPGVQTPGALPIRSAVSLTAIAEVRRRQIQLEALRQRHKVAEKRAEAELAKAEAVMMQIVEALEATPSGVGFKLNLSNVVLEPKRDEDLDKVIAFVARLTDGTATSDALDALKNGDLPAGVPARLSVGDNSCDLRAWISDLAAFLSDGGEQAEYAVQRLLRDEATCVAAIKTEAGPAPLHFLARLCLAGGWHGRAKTQ